MYNIQKKALVAVALSSLFATSAMFAAGDYTIIKNSDRNSGTSWWTGGTFQDASGNTVTSPATVVWNGSVVESIDAIDNLRFSNKDASVFITGANSGMYFVNNIQGSSTEAQTITFISNSGYQNAHIANITGTKDYTVTVNFGLASDAEKRNTLIRTYTEYDVANNKYVAPTGTKTQTTYSYANVNAYGPIHGNHIVLKNNSVFTIKPLSSRVMESQIYKMDVNTGTKFVFDATNGEKLIIQDYLSLNGIAEFTGDANSAVIKNKIRFNGGTVKLHGSNLLTTSTTGSSAISMNIYSSGRFELGGNEDFKDVYFTVDKSGGKYVDTVRTLTFQLSDDTTLLTISKFGGALTADYAPSIMGIGTNTDGSEYSYMIKVIFENFKDNTVKITQDLTTEELANCFFAEGVEGFAQNSDGFLYAIPEPAEWVAIFGALALGFAVYRRKK